MTTKITSTEKKFLAQIKESEHAIVKILIPKIYQFLSYFCKRCNKFSDDKMCECGNFPEPTFKISGLITDGTATMPFKTLSKKVSEDLYEEREVDVKNIDPKKLMSKFHTILGYKKGNRFFIEKVL